MDRSERQSKRKLSPVVFRDRERSRFLLGLAAGLLIFGLVLASDVDALTDRVGIVLAFGVLAVISFQTARLGVEVAEQGIKLRGYVRVRSIAWSDISYFSCESMPGRLTRVPVVVLQSGRKIAIHGLDSVFSGFGAASPLWNQAIASLSDELSRHRSARWR